MKVQKAEILAALTKVKPGLAKKEIVEQATHFVFVGNEIVTFNDQLCIMHPFECDAEFSVKGEEFFKIISNIAEEEFTLTEADNTVKIKSKSTKASLSTVVGETATVTHLIEKIKADIAGKDFWKPLPKDFVDGLYLCAFSASRDLATGVRACVAIKGETVYSTDGLRASMYVYDSKMDELLIPAKDAMELSKYKVKEYGISDNWVHFRTKDGIVFNCKAMKGEYPYKAVSNIFEDDEPTVSLPDTLKEAVSSVLILADGDMDINRIIQVEVESGKIICKAEKERGKMEKVVPFDYKGDDFKFAINPIFFNQILQHATGLNLYEDKAMFSSDNFWHIVSLPVED